MKIRIMSSNVWGNTPSDHIVADRSQNLSVIFKKYRPYVLGCQEFSPRMRAEGHNLSEIIRDVYTEVPEAPQNKYQNNYTPIFYDSSKVTLCNHGYFYYSGLNDIGSKSASWAIFTDITGGKRFLFINTHYYWTNDDAGREARISNTKELLELFRKINTHDLPTFVTGDFNCMSPEPPIVGLEEHGFRQARLTAKEPVDSIKSYHAYPKFNSSDPDAPFWEDGPMPTDRMDQSIDHIFTHGDVTVERFITVTDKEALNSSDHCPIYIDADI